MTADTWEQGSAYERFIGRWSRELAPAFLDWLSPPPGAAWVDIGCGTGALAAAILERCAPRSVAGVEPSEGFRRTASANLGARAIVLAGDACAIPLPDGAVDFAVSALVLNFVADSKAALEEMKRVTRPGGVIAAYVWDYAGKMEYLRAFWDAARSIDPRATDADEGARFPLCRPEALRNVFEAAGLTGVDVTALEIPTTFASFDDLWQPFLGGQGPAPAFAMALSEAARDRLREAFRSRVPMGPDGSTRLVARAWGVRGTTR